MRTHKPHSITECNILSVSTARECSVSLIKVSTQVELLSKQMVQSLFLLNYKLFNTESFSVFIFSMFRMVHTAVSVRIWVHASTRTRQLFKNLDPSWRNLLRPHSYRMGNGRSWCSRDPDTEMHTTQACAWI